MSSMHAHVMPVTAEQPKGLREHMTSLLQEYFNQMDDAATSSNQNKVLKEVEAALYESVMKYMRGNQSRAARFLGVSRGTLRTKLKEYFGTTHVGVN